MRHWINLVENVAETTFKGYGYAVCDPREDIWSNTKIGPLAEPPRFLCSSPGNATSYVLGDPPAHVKKYSFSPQNPLRAFGAGPHGKGFLTGKELKTLLHMSDKEFQVFFDAMVQCEYWDESVQYMNSYTLFGREEWLLKIAARLGHDALIYWDDNEIPESEVAAILDPTRVRFIKDIPITNGAPTPPSPTAGALF